MPNFTLYHNQCCSKSRAAMQLLQEHNVVFDLIHYLDNPLNEAQIGDLLTKLDIKAINLIRQNEPIFAELNLKNTNEDELIKAMAVNPKLIERPIICNQTSGVIGRPPAKVLEFVQSSTKFS